MKEQNDPDFSCYITDDISTDNYIQELTKTIGKKYLMILSIT